MLLQPEIYNNIKVCQPEQGPCANRPHPLVSQDATYQAAMLNSDRQNARLESNHVLSAVMLKIMADNIKIYKQYSDNADFKKWFSDMVFNLTYNKEGKTLVGGRK